VSDRSLHSMHSVILTSEESVRLTGFRSFNNSHVRASSGSVGGGLSET